ncbi:uncharacterized protein LOC132609336 [Lycium barbarum]|uniref:uncharacterized protein LOC132609336 n=1 Tax=Lycium barbarum TaxID=112863 RepID=UPI00293F5CF4|nr:uncharacterized protein LOC132609336 [Lycium barbarum]
MTSKTNDGVDSSIVLTPFFDGNDFEYWKIRMRTYLKAEDLWTIVENGYEEPEDDGELSVAEMKNLEAKRRQDAKALSKIQMGVSRAFFTKIATCETAKQAWESLEAEVCGDEKVRTINLQTLRREFQNLKMIESEKINEYCTRVMNIVNEMRNHGDEISDQQVVEKILISVTKKYEYIVASTEETKELSKLSIKELVGSFRAHEKRRFFRENQPKETAFQSRTNENSQNFLKNQQKKKYNSKKKQDRDDSTNKVEEKATWICDTMILEEIYLSLLQAKALCWIPNDVQGRAVMSEDMVEDGYEEFTGCDGGGCVGYIWMERI